MSKPKNDLTGVENYVLDLIKKENVDWIPIKKFFFKIRNIYLSIKKLKLVMAH